MFKRWLSNFWKRNKAKITLYLKSCLGIILVAYMVFAIISFLGKSKQSSEGNIDETKQVHRPTKTISSGKDISKEEYEEEKNLVQVFLDNCNDGNVEEAYNLLTDYCKKELYPNVDTFKTMYYDNIFTEKRTYNMQSWVVKDNYHTYLIRFVNDAITTGVYKKDNVYQDYITICEENNNKKISIGKYIKYDQINSSAEENSIKITVTGKKVYMDYIIYVLNVENKSGKTISIDAYENLNGINVIMNNKVQFPINWNGFNMDNLILKKGQSREIELMFNIPYGINSKPKKIEFSNLVLDYDEYLSLNSYEEQTKYENKTKINISF